MSYKKMIERADGWCDWLFPLHLGYKMACCDCGLVHDMQFQVATVSKKTKAGTFTATDVSGEKYRVKFRAKRNIRATAAKRRKKPQ